jgi:hypothetical protein
MKQWDLRGATRTVFPPTIPARVSPSHPSMSDRFPLVLWGTDTALRFTTRPRIRDVVAIGGEPEDVLDLGSAVGVVDAHLRALRGEPAIFDLPLGGHDVRCFAFPIRTDGGEVTGTISVAMGGFPQQSTPLPIAG